MLRLARPTAAACFAGALLLAACGGSDSASSPATATPAPTTPDTAADDTTPDDTTGDTATDDTTDSTIATDGSEVAIEHLTFTADELAAALPTVADLGEGWTDLGGTPDLAPTAGEGPGVGSCGGPNGVARAQRSGVGAVALGPNLQGPDLRRGATSIYTFPDAESALAFLVASDEVIECPDNFTWQQTQRTNPSDVTEYNGFGPGFEGFADGEQWTITESDTSDFAEDDVTVLFASVERTRELTAAGITFRQTQTNLSRYEVFDNIVILTQITGDWGFAGFINLDDLIAYEPTDEALDEYSATVTPLVLDRLGWEQ